MGEQDTMSMDWAERSDEEHEVPEYDNYSWSDTAAIDQTANGADGEKTTSAGLYLDGRIDCVAGTSDAQQLARRLFSALYAKRSEQTDTHLPPSGPGKGEPAGDETATADDIAGRLEYLRGQLRAECISWSELADLQGLAEHIEPGDLELLEAAGVPESPPDD
jgi:hypothetical protein